MSRIGLVAGEGKLPIVFSRIAREKGDSVIAFGLKGVADEDLARHVEKLHWLEWGGLQKAFMLFVGERIKKIILLGKLKKERFFKEEAALDGKAAEMLKKLADKKDYAILNEAADRLKKLGIEVIDCGEYLKDLIPLKGVLTARRPTKEEEEDIDYGRSVAKDLARFDIGQTITLKDKTVIAVEAMEGTDEAVLRSGGLVKGGFTVIKVARPDQDMRFDVPLVGADTMKALVNAGAGCLALEADKTFLIDREEVVRLADENNIAIAVI